MNPINLVAITASLNLLLQLYMAVVGNYAVATVMCDFSEDTSRFHKGKTLLFKHVFQEDDIIEISCPSHINGVKYAIYPENPTKYAYVYNYRYYQSDTFSFRLKKWPLEQIFGKISSEPIVRWKNEVTRDTLIIQYPRDGTLVRRLDTYLVYICKPKGSDYESSEMKHELRKALSAIYPLQDDEIYTLSSKDETVPFVEPTAIFKLSLADVPIVTHGCGYRSGNLFLNQEKRNTDEAYETCTVDIMKNPNVGFYCDGILEPPDCFDKLIGYHDPAKPNLAFGRLPPSIHGLHYMNYDRTRYPKPFSGSCYCKDNDTNKVKASITVTRGVTQTCDLASLLFKNRILPFVDDWCDVVLHPVDTLTIIYPPVTGIYDHMSDEYEHFKSFKGPWMSAMVPSNPEAYFMRRVFTEDGDELQFAELASTYASSGLIIKHDEVNRSITVKSTKTGLRRPSFIFHYIWKYSWPNWAHGDIYASVQVRAVLDPDYRNRRGALV